MLVLERERGVQDIVRDVTDLHVAQATVFELVGAAHVQSGFDDIALSMRSAARHAKHGTRVLAQTAAATGLLHGGGTTGTSTGSGSVQQRMREQQERERRSHVSQPIILRTAGAADSAALPSITIAIIAKKGYI